MPRASTSLEHGFALAAALCALAACRHEPVPSGAHQNASGAALNALAPNAPSASARGSTSGAPAPSVAGDSVPPAHCKALGKKATLAFDPIPEAQMQLSEQNGELFALGYTHDLARSRFYRFSRDGGPLQLVAEQQGLGDPKRFAVADGAAYYAQAGKLFKLGPNKDQSAQLYDGVQSPVAVLGSEVFAIACDAKAKADRLLQIPSDGGAAKTLAELPHASADRCQYSSVVADERDVFIADWNALRIVAVSRADKSLRTVVSKRGFPGSLLLEPDAVVFSSALGMFRVGRDGGATARLASSDTALAPFSFIAKNSDEYWVFDALPYTTATTLFRIPRAGGAPKAFMALHNADPNAENIDGQGLQDFALDDECVYVAQTQFKRPGVQIVVKALR